MSSATDAPEVKHHVYLPFRAGLPPLRRYFGDLWTRRHFVAAYSRASIRAANSQTVFGQLWLVLNPLLLAAVYYLLVTIIGGKGLEVTGPQLLAQITGGLFLFNILSSAMLQGAQSVVTGGKLLLNLNFPRLMMPLGAVRTAVVRFLPTLPVYFIIRAFADEPFGWEMFLGIYYILLMIIFAIGLSALFATIMVYFRDTTSFLPYLTRIWLYGSPVLLPIARFKQYSFAEWMNINPLYSIVGGWQETMLHGTIPEAKTLIVGAIWAIGMAIIGSIVFMVRERDFAVRI